MNTALLNATAGMKARMESLDVLGNNIANASTHGFKADREFYRLFSSESAKSDPQTGDLGVMPMVRGSQIDFRQGPVERTDSPLDVALSGPGFLTVQAGDDVLYTRAGALQRGSNGELLSPQGLAVLDSAGQPITLPPAGRVTIAENGWISVGGLSITQLNVVEFDDTSSLSKAGDSLFAGEAPSRPAAATIVRQGHLEGANIELQESAVELIAASRQFEMLRRAASLIGDDMEGEAVARLGRLS